MTQIYLTNIENLNVFFCAALDPELSFSFQTLSFYFQISVDY